MFTTRNTQEGTCTACGTKKPKTKTFGTRPAKQRKTFVREKHTMYETVWETYK
ncbi:MAG: hypothetical protein ACLFQK_04585 [Fibrobacterota bacterium]